MIKVGVLGARGRMGTAVCQAVDAAALRAFWQGHYRPERAALVVAGDLSEAELRALIEPLFGAWKPAGDAAKAGGKPSPSPKGEAKPDKK